MPTVDDMFPALDYDSLNKGLGFVNFNIDPTQSLQLDLNSDQQRGVNDSKDGEIPSVDIPPGSNMEVSEVEIPANKNWEALTRAERIELVKQQATGMPLIAKLDLSLLKRASSRFQEQGMYEESRELKRIAVDFEKSMTLVQRETENEGTNEALVSVQEDGETFTRTFKDPSEAKEFYDSLTPKVEEVKGLIGVLTGYNMLEEASSLDRFIKQCKIFDAELPLLLQGSTVWNEKYGIGKVAWIEGDTYEVVFSSKPHWLGAKEARGQVIFFEKRPEDNVPSGFYKLLSNISAFMVETLEKNENGEPEKVRIGLGAIKLIDSYGKIHVVKDYPLLDKDDRLLGTTKMTGNSLRPYDSESKHPEEENLIY